LECRQLGLRTGTYDSRAPESYQDWLAKRPPDERHQPFWWEDEKWNNPIFPVVGVTWYEADAYVRWLNTQVQVTGSKLHVWQDGEIAEIDVQPKTLKVHLSSEEEWERAVPGTDGCVYPWGDEFAYSKANVAEELGEGMPTTAVCTYPQGVSPVGAWDMSGNVCGWTRSRYGEYRFVLRGGCWISSGRTARCAYRSSYMPGDVDRLNSFWVTLFLVVS
jgi:formylglycine-generating enzyme required for sulfatase activity